MLASESTRILVPVEPFQRRFRELEVQGVTASDIADRIGWRDPRRRAREHGSGDGKRVLRALGLVSQPVNRREGGGKRWNRAMEVRTAKLMAEAMWSDPVDLGF